MRGYISRSDRGLTREGETGSGSLTVISAPLPDYPANSYSAYRRLERFFGFWTHWEGSGGRGWGGGGGGGAEGGNVGADTCVQE